MDGLATFKNMSTRYRATRSGKSFAGEILADLALKIIMQNNLMVVNYLDVTLNLTNGKYYPYRYIGQAKISQSFHTINKHRRYFAVTVLSAKYICMCNEMATSEIRK